MKKLFITGITIWRNVSYSQNNVFLLGKVYTVVNDVRVKNKKIQRKSSKYKWSDFADTGRAESGYCLMQKKVSGCGFE